MANPYYNSLGVPAAGSPALSGPIRAQFLSIEAGFDKCGSPYAGGFWRGNATGSAMEFSYEHLYQYQSKEDASVFFYGGNGTATASYASRKYVYMRTGRLFYATFNVAFLLAKNTDSGAFCLSLPLITDGSPLSSTILCEGGPTYFAPFAFSTGNQTIARLSTIGANRALVFGVMDWDDTTTPMDVVSHSEMANTNYVIYGAVRGVLGPGI